MAWEPEVIYRSEWSLAPDIYARNRKFPGPWVWWIGHTAAVDFTARDTRSVIRQAQGQERFHIETRGWNGIAYNWLLAPAGQIVEGRGWLAQGGHTEGHNTDGHGIQFMGNGDMRPATPEQIASWHWLRERGIESGRVSRNWRLGGHFMFSLKGKTCPGMEIRSQWSELAKAVGPIIDKPPKPPPLSEEDDVPLYLANGQTKRWLLNPYRGTRVHLAPGEDTLYARMIGKGVEDMGDVPDGVLNAYRLIVPEHAEQPDGGEPDSAYYDRSKLAEDLGDVQQLLARIATAVEPAVPPESTS